MGELGGCELSAIVARELGLPDCALELVEGGGHLPWLDAPERAARHIESFFSPQGRVASPLRMAGPLA